MFEVVSNSCCLDGTLDLPELVAHLCIVCLMINVLFYTEHMVWRNLGIRSMQ